MTNPCKCSHSSLNHLNEKGKCQANLSCTCQSFESRTGKIEPTWDEAFTLKDYFEKLLNDGNEEEAVDLMQKLPQSVRSRYRSIYVQYKQSRKNGKS